MNTRVITDGELLIDDDNPDLEAAFAEFRDSIAQDQSAEGYIKVWKLPLDKDGNPRSNSMQQSELFTLPLGESSIDDLCDRVRRQYMRPGEHRITICVRGYQRGKRGIRFQRIMTLERENDPEPAAASGSMASELATFMRIVQQSNEAAQARTESFMREMMGMMRSAPAPAVNPADPVAMMQQVGTMMGIFNTMFSGMRAPAAAPGSELTALLTQVEQLKKLGNILNPGAPEEESGAVGVIKAVTPLAGPLLQLMAAQAAQRPMRRKELPAPAKPGAAKPGAARPAPAAPAATPAPTPEPEGRPLEEDEQMKIREALNELCDMAQRNDDPVAAAALALDMLPDEYDAQVGALVSEPETFLPKLKLICPRTAQFPVWFESLRAEMARAYEEDPDAPGEEDDDD